jgi:hypothetical protein
MLEYHLEARNRLRGTRGDLHSLDIRVPGVVGARCRPVLGSLKHDTPAARRLTEIVEQLRELEAEIGAIDWHFVSGRLQKRGLQLFKEAARLLPLVLGAESNAIDDARGGDTRKLIAYLRSDRPLSPRLRRFTADLLAGKLGQRGRPPGRRVDIITDLDLLVSASHDWEKAWRKAGYTNRGPGGGGIHEESAMAVVEHLKRGDVKQIVARLRKGRVRPHVERTRAGYRQGRAAIEAVLKDWRKRSRITGANLPN